MRTGRKHTGGMTLVEMLASLGLLALLMLSAVTLLLSFFNAFSHLRQLQSDQTIADTLAEKTASQLRGATAIADPAGGESVAFVNRDGYVVLISTGGFSGTVPPAKADSGGTGTAYDFPAGRAAQLYCTNSSDGYRPAAARGFDGWFGTEFYMGRTVHFAFSLQRSGSAANCLTLAITLSGGGRAEYVSTHSIDLSNTPQIVSLAPAQE